MSIHQEDITVINMYVPNKRIFKIREIKMDKIKQNRQFYN